jgi:hypothetical protein
MGLVPIVLFVYNRPAHSEQTLEALAANDLTDWVASGLLMSRVWGDNLDRFETFQADAIDPKAGTRRFYRLLLAPLW